jgi:hypothetical protein
MKYLLPCSCGRSITIDIGQAGRRVTCACGASQDVPTLRAIRKLPPAGEEKAAKSAAPRAWSPLQGALFGVGATLAFLSACVLAYSLSVLWKIDLTKARDETDAELAAAVDFSVDRSYELYVQIRAEGLGEFPTQYMRRRYAAGVYFRLSMGALTGAVVGVLLIVGSIFVRPAADRGVPRKRAA